MKTERKRGEDQLYIMNLSDYSILENTIRRRLNNQLSAEELDSLEEWRSSSVENELLYKDILKVAEVQHSLSVMKRFNAEKALGNVKNEIKTHKEKKISVVFRTYQRIAAILLLPIIITSLFVYFGNRPGKKSSSFVWQTVRNTEGTLTSMQLKDGTKVWLNGGSSIEYPTFFSGDSRNVRVNGEVFFDVAKSKEYPFIVDCGAVAIKVLGTRFNVKNYNDDSTIGITLEEGSIQLQKGTLPDEKAIAILKPSEHASFRRDKKGMNISRGNIEKYIAWIDGRLVFQDDHMSNVIKKLKRKFNVEIVWDENQWDDFRLNASFTDESLEQILTLLAESEQVKYKLLSAKRQIDGTYAKRKIRIFK